MDDIFIKIIEGKITSDSVYEDKNTFAFLDINPVNPGHTLVVPKKRCRDIYDIPEELWRDVMSTVQKVAKAVKVTTGADGINIMMNNEAPAGQAIFHAHVHVIPRFEGDGMKQWHGKSYKTKDESKALAEEISKQLK